MYSQSRTRNALCRTGIGCVATLVALALAACEAPLNLEQVSAEKAKEVRRYDLFQAASHSGSRVVVVNSIGAILLSDDDGATWLRSELTGRPSLIDVDSCDNGDFFALDSERRVWHLPAGESDWSSEQLDTYSDFFGDNLDTLSVNCAPGGRLWVSASFSTLYSRELDETVWQSFTLEEDLQFTNVHFIDEQTGFAVGEYGIVLATKDAGQSWEQREPVPNEFYPMASDFVDANRGWIGGLDGVIWRTEDGAQSWDRQETVTAAPVYSIHASYQGVYAAGESAKLVEYVDGQWRPLAGAPEVLAFLRGLETLSTGDLLVAGAGGTLAVIPLRPEVGQAQP